MWAVFEGQLDVLIAYELQVVEQCIGIRRQHVSLARIGYIQQWKGHRTEDVAGAKVDIYQAQLRKENALKNIQSQCLIGIFATETSQSQIIPQIEHRIFVN